MKVLIVSHAYLEPESRKNIYSLSVLADVKCVLPNKWGVLIFSDYTFEAEKADFGLFHPLVPIRLFGSQFILKGLKAVFEKHQADIVFVEYNPWSAIFFQLLLLKKLVSPHSIMICSVKKNTYRKAGWSRIKDTIAKLILPHVDFVFSASQMAAKMFETVLAFPHKKIAVCHPLGVDISVFRPRNGNGEKPDQPIIVGYCGRFDAEKGVLDLIEAVRQLQGVLKRPVLLKLLGEGAYRGKPDRLINDLKNQFSWLTTAPPVRNAEVVYFLQSLDIFVLAARRLADHQEHDAHALLEALACGVACIGTTSGIISEILGGGIGKLVEPEKPEDLSRALRELIEDDEARKKYGQLGRVKAEREFSLDVIAAKKMRVFEGIKNGQK